MPSGQHALSSVPDDLIGKAIKDPAFRRGVLERRDDHDALNAWLAGQSIDPIDGDAFAAISALNPDAVEAVVAGLQLNPDISHIAAA
jgi:hypothetical protein